MTALLCVYMCVYVCVCTHAVYDTAKYLQWVMTALLCACVCVKKPTGVEEQDPTPVGSPVSPCYSVNTCLC